MRSKGAAPKLMASMRSTGESEDGYAPDADAPTGKSPKPKMVRKVPQRDGLAKMAKEMSKRFGG